VLAEVERCAPDLVLLDPGPDPESRRAALRLAAALRARPASRDSGVILAARDRAEGAAALDLGAADWLPAPLDLPELAARLRLQLRRKRYGDLLRGAVRDGLAMAATDALTGLSNRRCAETHLSRMLTRCAREGRPLSVMLLDLDRFKAINDAHGHPAGDAVLRGFAERLRGEVRAGDLVARLGGEEFCVAMPGAGAAEARGVAERVRAAVAAAPFPVPGGPAAPVTVSIGLAVADPGAAPRAAAPLRPAASAAPPGLAEDAAPPPLRRRAAPAPLRAEGAAALIASADDALYRSKAAGRDRITLSAAGEATR
jgi:two-component system cell cycle response regulator